MKKTVALALLILALGLAGAIAASNFATTQEWSVYTASNCYVTSYNYMSGTQLWYPNGGASPLTTSGTIDYTLPNPNEWMGFWTYDVNSAAYTEVVYIMTETY